MILDIKLCSFNNLSLNLPLASPFLISLPLLSSLLAGLDLQQSAVHMAY